MNRRYTDAPTIRKVLQSIWYQVNHGQEIYVIGAVLPDHTVKGGTGWGAEFAKLCNKPLFVFDQDRDRWFAWKGESGSPAPPASRSSATRLHGPPAPAISADNGKAAIAALFDRSFPADPSPRRPGSARHLAVATQTCSAP